jgi:uncharacterized protein (TIGR03086 family)
VDGTQAAVELLERAIGYTRGTLTGVTRDRLDDATPCTQWRLRDLLDHMADSLDAFTEASSGLVPIRATHVRGTPVEVLREKACALLGAWTSPAAETVWMGGPEQGGPGRDERAMDARVLLRTGALEIAVHGWDVGQATGLAVPLPEGLARALTPAALALISEEDRGVRFAPAIGPCSDDGPVTASASLLGFCGRTPRWSHQPQDFPG